MHTTDSFADKLVSRLRLRTSGGVRYYVLDLRRKSFGNRGVFAVRSPGELTWPHAGSTTDDPALATRLVREHYAPYLKSDTEAAELRPELSGITVEEACDRYLAELEEEKGPDHNTLRNRRYDIAKHILPTFGSRPLTSLTKADVIHWTNQLQVEKPDGRGGKKRVKAKRSTKRAIRAALVAVWDAVLPHLDCPYRGARIKRGNEMRVWRQLITEGDLEKLLKPKSGALTPEKVLRLLSAAAYYDEKLASMPNTAERFVPNTLYILVVAIATGLRVSELRLLRWEHISESEGIIYVMGTKTESAVRIVPLQKQLRPWLTAIRELGRPRNASADWVPDRLAPVFFTNAARPNRLMPTRTIGNRYSEALRLAGLKQVGKACHGTRATFATWASKQRKVLSTESLKAYLGHANPWGGATDDYIEELKEMMEPSHRHVIRHLPSPAEVAEAVKSFTPAELPNWRDRRPRWSPRNMSRTEAQS